jgi:4-amino-4-deoxy-L-arabinose transferase-like glycosyltransferase
MSATTRQRPARPRRSRVAQAQAWPATAASATPVLLDPGPERVPIPSRAALPPPKRHRLRQWLRAHWLSLLIVAGLLLAVGLVHAIGYDRFPGRINDDEGTYVAQAWAVQHWHSLTHYTYWYDHPPVGWINIAGYTWLTRAFDRLPTAVSAGREFMIVVKLVSAAMLYLLGRRLGFHRLAAAAAVLLFGLSPLAVPFQRMVFLDNPALMWTLAALALAASPKRSLAASVGSGACFAIAVLSKETSLVLFPALFLLLWQHTSPRTRRYNIALFLTVLGGLVFLYPLYAILKNELLEGPGHVSLLWAIKWQLFDRIPSGSLLDPASRTHAVARSWLDQDPWLLGTGLLLIPLGLLFRRLRAITLALVIQVVMLFRNGFLPYAYVVAMLPFAALLVAGVADHLCKGYAPRRSQYPRRRGEKARAWVPTLTRTAGQLLVISAIVASLLVVAPAWSRELHQQMTEDRSQPVKQALAYAVANIPIRSILLTDDNLWPDLLRNGFNPNPVWFYKLDLDPEIRAKYKNGWRDIDYVVIGHVPPVILRDLPLVTAALENSEVIARFGSGETEVTVRRVIKNAPD